ncbi:MAG: hypothetical protein KF884_07660 [Fimbriimonadaceae bacterium]|nr:hypothetical protein [Fimbriimonadaceae bacterium]QYK57426.1 MAG: hypothetical protein KF884_07660 [Fimbriimonadaceae bacterium]
MLYATSAFIAVAVLVAFGLGLRNKSAHEEGQVGGTVVGGLLALLGLLLAFSFSAAWSRFNQRLDLAIDEANAISTLEFRLLFGGGSRDEAREALLKYVRGRLEFNEWLARPRGSEVAGLEQRTDAAGLQSAVFETAFQAREAPDRALIVQALNEVLDLGNKRRIEGTTHVPWLVTVVIGLTAILSAAIAGRELGKGNVASQRAGWVFAVCVAATLFAIFDLEDPRVGLIRIDHADVLLREVKESLEFVPPSP